MFEHHKKESPIIGLAGMGGGVASYIFYSSSGGDPITRSVRFDGDNGYFSQTPSAGSTTTFTWSGWVKKSSITSNTTFFSAGSDGTNRSHFMFDGGSHQLRFFDLPTSTGVISSATYTDCSDWFHFVLAVDTNQGTPADRVKFYVNGTQITSFSSAAYPSQGANMQMTSAVEHRLGSGIAYGEYFKGYLADVHLVDGSQLDASSFAETVNSEWVPKSYSSPHGTAGFHLTFLDTTSDSTLGTDSSSSGNNFTVNNIKIDEFLFTNGYDGSLDGYMPAGVDRKVTDVNTMYDTSNRTYFYLVDQNSTSKIRISPTSTTVTTGSSVYDSWGNNNPTTTLNGGSITPNSSGTDSSVSGKNLATNTFTGLTIGQEYYISTQGGGSGNPHRVHYVTGATILNAPINSSDSVLDSPQDVANETGNNSGNYATLDPNDKGSQTNITLSNGNLQASNSASPQGRVNSTFDVSSGKWYFEAINLRNGTQFMEVGIIRTDQAQSYGIGFYQYGYSYISTGDKFNNNGTASYGNSYTGGDVIGVAFDLDAGTLIFYKNGVSQGTAYTGLSGTFTPAVGTYSSSQPLNWGVNFGQYPYKYTPPTNYLSLCSQNVS